MLCAAGCAKHGRPTVGRPTAFSETESCRFGIDGTIGGAVTVGDQPAPDGVFIDLVLSAGPALSTRSKGGRYQFPLLANICTSSKRFISFQLRAPGFNTNVQPTGSFISQDIIVNLTPQSERNECSLVLGTIRGRVTQGGKNAPDGTPVYTNSDPHPGDLTQVSITRSGQYSLTTVGIDCGEAVRFVQMRLYTLGDKFDVTPDSPEMSFDLTVR
jgi:hypothetical protein